MEASVILAKVHHEGAGACLHVRFDHLLDSTRNLNSFHPSFVVDLGRGELTWMILMYSRQLESSWTSRNLGQWCQRHSGLHLTKKFFLTWTSSWRSHYAIAQHIDGLSSWGTNASNSERGCMLMAMTVQMWLSTTTKCFCQKCMSMSVEWPIMMVKNSCLNLHNWDWARNG